jgi:hypothetical protein
MESELGRLSDEHAKGLADVEKHHKQEMERAHETYKREMIEASEQATRNMTEVRDSHYEEMTTLQQRCNLEIKEIDTTWQQRFNEVMNSTSWKITKPLRSIGKLFRR